MTLFVLTDRFRSLALRNSCVPLILCGHSVSQEMALVESIVWQLATHATRVRCHPRLVITFYLAVRNRHKKIKRTHHEYVQRDAIPDVRLIAKKMVSNI